MHAHEIAVPDCPASLFDADGTMLRGRPVVTIGIAAGCSLPSVLEQRLEMGAVPYRLVTVAPEDQLVVYAPTGAIEGLEAIAPLARYRVPGSVRVERSPGASGRRVRIDAAPKHRPPHAVCLRAGTDRMMAP